jgi:hypothetical protein
MRAGIMSALIRYQAAVLLRAHRWVGPLVLYATLLTFIGDNQPLREGLNWSAAILVPAVAWLTRSALTVEPAPARACVAAAGGPRRAHLAALVTAFGGGVILAVAGAGYELARCERPAGLGALVGALAAGLVTAAVCLLVGSAVGTLCNPPLVRHPAIALLATIGSVVIALVADVSPANAALRGAGSVSTAPAWLTGLPLLVALALVAASWLVSTLVAARRG